MNNKNITVLLGLVPAIFALSSMIIVGGHTNAAFAQANDEIVSGTPGEVGTVNNSEPYFPPLNMTGPETIEEFESIEGSNEAIFTNNTDISNPNITAAESTEINMQEDCMELPNQTGINCP